MSARLVSVADGVQIWHRRFERPEADLFAISDEAARAIAEALIVSVEVRPRNVIDDPRAIDLYLRARAAYHRFFSGEVGRSVELFEQALALAPDHPHIIAGYAMARARQWTRANQTEASARAAAERAMLVAPDLPETHVAWGMVLYQERMNGAAVRALKQALALAPQNAEAHDLLGRILAETMLFDAAERHLSHAIALEPDMELSRALLGRLHMLRGDDARAEATLMDGPSEGPRIPGLLRQVVWRRDVARAAEIERNLVPGNAATALIRPILDMVLRGAPPFGKFPDPSRVTDRFAGFIAQLETEAAGFLGDRERALERIEAAVGFGVFDMAWFERCPLLAFVRDDPRFLAARAKVKERVDEIEAAYRS